MCRGRCGRSVCATLCLSQGRRVGAAETVFARMAGMGDEGIELWKKNIFCGERTKKVDLAKWLPVFVLGPILPACFAVTVVTLGQVILSANGCTMNSQMSVTCDHVDEYGNKASSCEFVAASMSLAVMASYFFLLVFSWVFFGFSLDLPLVGSKDPSGKAKRKMIPLLRPFQTLGSLVACYIPIWMFSFLAFVLLTVSISVRSHRQPTGRVPWSEPQKEGRPPRGATRGQK